ncbi:MAG: 16S rRNA (cytosine(1402)-N(4))-methyltransferase RsmH [Gammaproteobacteria bacterium]|nr:16S rRNA (cytosine(1402)-N(4))-methyltransferase RsmH [Gammaproteobacteria bacterium]
MLHESLTALQITPDGIYVDATFGRGGHTAAILAQLNRDGRVIAFDQDPEAVAVAQQRFANEPRLTIYHAPFTELNQTLNELTLTGKINGILLDLGVSSPQLDDANRGFSFRHEGPLDMRMNPHSGISAAEWLAHANAEEIALVLKTYGEERFAKRIATAIVSQRQSVAKITTTTALAAVVAEAMPHHERDKHPATRTFQAIRIYINRELEALDQVLTQVNSALVQGGRLVVISFHSLEDRRVKRFMRDAAHGDHAPIKLPLRSDQLAPPQLRLIGKAQQASASEVAANPRARSAVLRVAERMA